MSYITHKGDLPDDIVFKDAVAIDSETMGLKNHRDKLCVVQLSGGDGTAHLVQLDRNTYDAPNLKKLLANKNVTKIFHYARFDIAMIKYYLDIWVEPVYCTKIASKLARTYSDAHGLKDVCNELLGKKISKQQQSSDWGVEELSKAQIEYAASDVLYLHELREKLDAMLAREGRKELAYKCFDFLKTRVELDIEGWEDEDIFAHSSKKA